MAIPALERGMILLETLIFSSTPLKYTDLKKQLPGISDSSLNRLISSLIETGYIIKNRDNRYIPSGRIRQWGEAIKGQQDLNQRIKRAVDHIVGKSHESAAFAVFEEGRIQISYSRSKENSISIIGEGQTVHFEDDHAAALAILGQLDEKHRGGCLAGGFSRIESMEILEQSMNSCSGDIDGQIYYLDRSRDREGISRLAVPLSLMNKPCAFFICAPSVRIEKNLKNFLSFLKEQLNSFNDLNDAFK